MADGPQEQVDAFLSADGQREQVEAVLAVFRRTCDTAGQGTIELNRLAQVLKDLDSSGLTVERAKELVKAFGSGSGCDGHVRYEDFLRKIFAEHGAGPATALGCNASRTASSSLTPSCATHLLRVKEAFPFQGYITHTEHRGISLRQLARVLEHASRHCSDWRDLAPTEFSFTSGQTLQMDFLNLYHLNAWLIMPATKENNCAFVELLAFQGCPQLPSWFVSHWWGERVVDFVKCLQLHAGTRELTEDTVYWVCAYANRQHSLSEELVDDPLQTSFYKAMQLAQKEGGVLLVLDERTPQGTGPATAFTRIWCAFEESMALKLRMRLDIAAFHSSEAHLLTDGVTRSDEQEQTRFQRGGAARAKAERENKFPLEIISSGLTLELEKANASVQSDKTRILNCLACNSDLLAAPPTTHPNYMHVNTRLRATFAVAAWRQAVEKNRVEVFSLPDVLRKDATRDGLTLDFTDCQQLNDAGLAALARGLPPALKTLNLCFAHCSEVGDEGLAALADALPSSLCELKVRFELCSRVGDEGLKAFAARLPQLRALHLDLCGCSLVSDSGLGALAEKMPASVRFLGLYLSRCSRITDLSVAQLARKLPASLRTLNLQFASCSQVGDEALSEIARALPPSLSSLKLCCRGCSSGDRGLSELLKQIPPGAAVLALDFEGTGASQELLDRCEAVLFGQQQPPEVSGRPWKEDPDEELQICGVQYQAVDVKGVHMNVPAHMKLVKLLGKGSFGPTALFKDTETGNRICVKKIEDAFSRMDDAKRTVRELKIARFLDHDNLAGVLDMFPPLGVDFDDFYIVQAYMETDLHNVIRSQQRLGQEHHSFFAYQILRGLLYLHSAGVAHCNLKPSAILLDMNCIACITDFGSACSTALGSESAEEGEEDLEEEVVNRWYCSPEDLCLAKEFTTTRDIWGAGCILGELILRKPTFVGSDMRSQLQKILEVLGSPSQEQCTWLPHRRASALLSKLGPYTKQPWLSILPGTSEQAASLLDSMLSLDPRERSCALQCLEHPYFADHHDPGNALRSSGLFDWSFERAPATRRALQNRVYVECARLHPEILRRDAELLGPAGIAALMESQSAEASDALPVTGR